MDVYTKCFAREAPSQTWFAAAARGQRQQRSEIEEHLPGALLADDVGEFDHSRARRKE
ncbi:hypothetical protein ACNJYC_11215 [Bradyrhizobium sp. DASA03007]